MKSSVNLSTSNEESSFVEVQTRTLRCRTVSWFRIVNGINKYLTETSEDSGCKCLETEIQGNLSRKPEYERRLYCIVNEDGWIRHQDNLAYAVLKCPNL